MQQSIMQENIPMKDQSRVFITKARQILSPDSYKDFIHVLQCLKSGSYHIDPKQQHCVEGALLRLIEIFASFPSMLAHFASFIPTQYYTLFDKLCVQKIDDWRTKSDASTSISSASGLEASKKPAVHNSGCEISTIVSENLNTPVVVKPERVYNSPRQHRHLTKPADVEIGLLKSAPMYSIPKGNRELRFTNSQPVSPTPAIVFVPNPNVPTKRIGPTCTFGTTNSLRESYLPLVAQNRTCTGLSFRENFEKSTESDYGTQRNKRIMSSFQLSTESDKKSSKMFVFAESKRLHSIDKAPINPEYTHISNRRSTGQFSPRN